jgi:hypothetical protein
MNNATIYIIFKDVMDVDGVQVRHCIRRVEHGTWELLQKIGSTTDPSVRAEALIYVSLVHTSNIRWLA